MSNANGAVFIPSSRSPDQALFEEVQSRMYLEPAKWLVILEGLVDVCRSMSKADTNEAPTFPPPPCPAPACMERQAQELARRVTTGVHNPEPR